jgi:hypothetical protein
MVVSLATGTYVVQLRQQAWGMNKQDRPTTTNSAGAGDPEV